MSTISAATATELAYAHQEVERGREMLAMLDEYDRKEKEDKNGPFHIEGVESALRRRVRGYELRIPERWGTTHGWAILSGVSPEITRCVILAHIEKQRARLAELCIKARMELDGLVPDSDAEFDKRETGLVERILGTGGQETCSEE